MERGVGGVAPRVGEEIAAELIRRRQKIDQDELEFSVLAAAYAHTNEYEEQGFDSPISWIKANCHMSGGAAGDRGCIGEQLVPLGQSPAAMGARENRLRHPAPIPPKSPPPAARLYT